MASGDLYEVERIVDKRKNKKGKWEYLIRWKGYGSSEDTWEPENHLLHCEEFIDEFNGLHLTRDRRARAGRQAVASKLLRGAPADKMAHRLPDSGRARGAAHKRRRMHSLQKQKKVCTAKYAPGERSTKTLTYRTTPSGLQIMPLNKPMENGDSGTHNEEKHFENGTEQEKNDLEDDKDQEDLPSGLDDCDTHLVNGLGSPTPTNRKYGLANGNHIGGTLRRGNGMMSSEGPKDEDDLMKEGKMAQPTRKAEEDHRMDQKGKLEHRLEPGIDGESLTNGGLTPHSPVKRKLDLDKECVFDKRLRYSIRQNESNCRFRDIVVRKEEGFTHILLSSQTSDNNALTPDIMKEVRRALCNASSDDSKLLLLSAVGSVFCSGLDYSYLIGRLSADRRKESTRIAEAIRDFVKAFIQFKKPIVVAINGPALGLGASILPLCDIVWASEKAWFQTPYATIRLTPAGCSSYTFPQILGVALANEMLFCGRKLTAQEACSRGLVSQVFWPTTFSQEVMLRVKEMAACSAVVLEESKCLVRSFLKSVLEDVNERECQMLKQLWSSTKGLDSLFSYLQDKIYEV